MIKIFSQHGINTRLRKSYGISSALVWNRIPEEPDEGAIGQLDGDGNSLDRAISSTLVKITDVISEGEINGLVEGEFVGKFTGTVDESRGQIGWDSVDFESNSTITPSETSSRTYKWLPSVYYNDLPVINKHDQFNFQQIGIQQSKGSPDGTVEGVIDTPLTIHRSIGERLRGGGESFAKTYRIKNKDCKGVAVSIKIVNLLAVEKQSSEKYGDKSDTTVDYTIQYRPIFTKAENARRGASLFTTGAEKTIKGYLNHPYVHQTTVTFGQDFSNTDGFLGYEIRVYRVTEDSITTTVMNQTYVDSFYEIYGNKFTYPNTAVVEHKFLAEYFGDRVPKRTYDVRGLRVKIPVDYDPITKTYLNGGYTYWNGEWNKNKFWTDNPAWIFYDLITNRRYGLGQYVHPDYLDKWTLYEIAKYCDQLVDDGYGGLEPRFTCNIVIKNRDAAHKVIQDLASVFRAITYFQGGSIFLSQDRQKKPVYQFNNSNVKNGDFVYQSSATKARRTVAIIRYREKVNDFDSEVEYVEDIEGIRKYGIREIEIAGVGITSRGQAIRYGQWMLLTEQMDQESLSFITGMEANILKPGDVISVNDQFRNTKRYGGRLSLINNVSPSGDMSFSDTSESGSVPPAGGSCTVTLDSKIDLLTSSTDTYRFTLLVPSYQYDPSITNITASALSEEIRRSQLQSIDFNGSHISVNANGKTEIALPNGFLESGYQLNNRLIWSIEPTGSTKTAFSEKFNVSTEWKVMTVSEKDNEYNVTCIEYNDEKFQRLDGTIDFEQAEPSPTVYAPNSVSPTARTITQNTKELTWVIGPGNTTNVEGYYVYIKKGAWNGADFKETDSDRTSEEAALNSPPDSKYLIRIHSGPMDLSGEGYIPPSDGTYHFRVYSFNRVGLASDSYASNSIAVSGIKPIYDTHIHSLTLAVGTTTITDGEIDPGVRGEKTHDLSEPSVSWGIRVAGKSDIKIRYDYKVTIREVSNSNVPSQNIILTYQGYDSSSTDPTSGTGEYLGSLNQLSQGEFNFEFDINKNIKALTGSRVYLRDYDIVVEAIDSSGDSSAGTMSASSVSNPYGYDILELNNPRIGRTDMTPPEDLEACQEAKGQGGSGFCSDQYMDASGNVYIAYTDHSPEKATQDLTVKGGLLLISKEPFETRNQNDNLNANIKSETWREDNGIETVVFLNSSQAPNKISIIAGFIGSEAHIAVAYTDAYDERIRAEKGESYVLDLLFDQISNTQVIEMRSAIIGMLGGGGYTAFIAGEWSGWGGTITNVRAQNGLELVKTKQYTTWDDPKSSQYETKGPIHREFFAHGLTCALQSYSTPFSGANYSQHDRPHFIALLVSHRQTSAYRSSTHPKIYGNREGWYQKCKDNYTIFNQQRVKNGRGAITPDVPRWNRGGASEAWGHEANWNRCIESAWVLYFKFTEGMMPTNRYYVQTIPPIMWTGSTNNNNPFATVGVKYFDLTTETGYQKYLSKLDHVANERFDMTTGYNGRWRGDRNACGIQVDPGVGVAQARDGFAIKIQVSLWDYYSYARQAFYCLNGERIDKGQQIFIGVMSGEQE